MILENFRQKNGVDLKQGLLDLLKAHFKLRIQFSTQQLSDTSQLRKLRRDIARVRTMLHMKKAEKNEQQR